MSTVRALDAAKAFPVRPKGADGKRLCRVCGGAVKPPRRTVCGKACEDTIRICCWPSVHRTYVLARDHGVCRQCGFDAERLKRIVRHARLHWWLLERQRFGRGYLEWAADHIVPVWQGGGVTPDSTFETVMANLQTLCRDCHEAKSAREACRRATAKTGQAVMWDA